MIFWWCFWMTVGAAFAVAETLGVKGYRGMISCSTWVDLVTIAWPPFGPLLGGLMIGLLVHFYWHWSGPGGKGG